MIRDMRCPNCGNEVYELIDYAIARCTNCYSLWDPYIYPGFPVPNVEVGEVWDTTKQDDGPFEYELGEDDTEVYDSDEDEDHETDDSDDWDIDQEEDSEFDDDSDDWNDENDEEQDDEF
jgi:hypothetical protein